MKINRKEILNALEKVSPAVSSSSIINGSDLFHFNGNTVMALNDDIVISTKSPIYFVGSVPAEELLKLVSKLPDEEIDIESGKDKLIVKGSVSRKAKLNFKESQFIDLGIQDNEWQNLPLDFFTNMSKCIKTTSKNKALPLSCLYIDSSIMFSCDSYRVSKIVVESPIQDIMLISASIAKNLIDISFDSFQCGKGWIHFKSNDTVFSCRDVCSDFYKYFKERISDYTEFFNIDGVKIKLPDVKNELDRAEIFAGLDREGDKFVNVNIENNKLTILGESHKGSFEEEIDVDYNGNIEFKVSPSILKNVLDGGEVVINKDKLYFKIDNVEYVICCPI